MRSTRQAKYFIDKMGWYSEYIGPPLQKTHCVRIRDEHCQTLAVSNGHRKKAHAFSDAVFRAVLKYTGKQEEKWRLDLAE